MTYNRHYADNVLRFPQTTEPTDGTTGTPSTGTSTTTSTSSTGGTSSGTSSTGRAGARACARVGEEAHKVGENDEKYAEFLEVFAYFAAAYGSRPGPVAQRDIIAAQRAGITGAVIVHCIEESERAPRPSWAYARAVLGRCMAGNICTEEDWRRDREQWRRASVAPGREAGRFAQRTYTQAEYDAVFTDLELDGD